MYTDEFPESDYNYITAYEVIPITIHEDCEKVSSLEELELWFTKIKLEPGLYGGIQSLARLYGDVKGVTIEVALHNDEDHYGISVHASLRITGYKEKTDKQKATYKATQEREAKQKIEKESRKEEKERRLLEKLLRKYPDVAK